MKKFFRFLINYSTYSFLFEFFSKANSCQRLLVIFNKFIPFISCCSYTFILLCLISSALHSIFTSSKSFFHLRLQMYLSPNTFFFVYISFVRPVISMDCAVCLSNCLPTGRSLHVQDQLQGFFYRCLLFSFFFHFYVHFIFEEFNQIFSFVLFLLVLVK